MASLGKMNIKWSLVCLSVCVCVCVCMHEREGDKEGEGEEKRRGEKSLIQGA
jgi:hypothetical protein